MIVVDTNVMIHLLTDGEHSPAADLLLQQDPEWAAPVILMSELRNVLLGYVRRGVLVPDQAKAMTDDAASILGDRLAIVSGDHVLDVALECNLTAYDAEFVVLARTLSVPLATLDSAILRGAPDVAMSLSNVGELSNGKAV